MRSYVAFTTALVVGMALCIPLMAEESSAEVAEYYYCYGSEPKLEYPYLTTDVILTWTAVDENGDTVDYIELSDSKIQLIVDGFTHALVTQTVESVTTGEILSETYSITIQGLKEGESHVVTFMNGDEVHHAYVLDWKTVVVGDGHHVLLPEDPVKSGYSFTGWYLDKACTIPLDTKDVVVDDMTVHAGWEISGGDTVHETTIGNHTIVFQAVDGLNCEIVGTDSDSIRFRIIQEEGHSFEESTISAFWGNQEIGEVNGVYELDGIDGDRIIVITGVREYAVNYELKNAHVVGTAPEWVGSSGLDITLQEDDGYTNLRITVYMGAENVTSDCVEDGRVTITSATGDVLIIAEADDASQFPWIYPVIVIAIILAMVALWIYKRHES